MKSICLKTRLSLCMFVVVAAAGCSLGGSKGDGWKFSKALDVRKAVGLKKDELPEPQTPTRLVSTWTETVLNRQGEKPQRGFGGRLLFFNEDSENPIRVDGQLVVYAFDDGRADYETKPSRRFIFPREQFVRHESESKLGPSYSFWLPWDTVGGEQKNIDLIARFEPHEGPLIVGEQTRHLLPGTQKLVDVDSKKSTEQTGGIRLAQYSKESESQKPTTQDTAGNTSLSTQAISISLGKSNWQRRLALVNQQKATANNANAEAQPATVDPGPAGR